MSRWPDSNSGAYNVLAGGVIFFGILNLLPGGSHYEGYHRYPTGKVAGICYIILGSAYLVSKLVKRGKK
jgi:hypothetical protein